MIENEAAGFSGWLLGGKDQIGISGNVEQEYSGLDIIELDLEVVGRPGCLSIYLFYRSRIILIT